MGRHLAVALLLVLATTVRAQPASGLEPLMVEARTLTGEVSRLITGERLRDPTRLRDLAGILNTVSLTLTEIAVLAEQDEVSVAQRQRLTDTLAQARLIVMQTEAAIRGTTIGN